MIPDGWRDVRLGDVCFIDRHSLSSKTPSDYCFEYISLSDVDKGKLIRTRNYNLSEAPSRARRVVKQGDVLLATVRPNLQGFYIFREDVKDHIVSTGFAVLTPKDSSLNSEYLFQILFTDRMRAVFNVLNIGSSYPAINSSDIYKIEIPLPSLSEQKTIGKTLLTWDTAIEKTEALIAAKEKRFEWLLRRLMSDRRDDPKWRITTIDNLCEIKKGEQLNKLQLTQTGKYPALNGGVAPSGYTDKWNTVANTITISEGGNSCGYVNYNTQNFWAGGHCYTLINLSSGLDKTFFYYQLKEQERLIMRLRVGSGLPNIQKGDIEKFPVCFPPLPQQKKISHTLSVARREVDLLGDLVEQYRLQKRGLMQKLLTGKWRLNP